MSQAAGAPGGHPACATATIALSVVSHGHGMQVRQLLALLLAPSASPVHRIWLTLNVEEPGLEQELATLHGRSLHEGLPQLRFIRNPSPQGFGANHNQAFEHEQACSDAAPYFAVVNPDITWQHSPWASLLGAAAQPGAGCAYPRQVGAQGREQDYARALPSPWALLRRHWSGRARAQRHAPVRSPDWVNAALLLFHGGVYRKLGGFDTAYHMYCEDVDICLRLQLAGYRLVLAEEACVIHEAGRASRRVLRHLGWHLRSLLRLWASPAYRQYLALKRRRGPVVASG